MGTKSQASKDAECSGGAGSSGQNEDKVWSLDPWGPGKNKLLSPWGIWKVDSVQLDLKGLGGLCQVRREGFRAKRGAVVDKGPPFVI